MCKEIEDMRKEGRIASIIGIVSSIILFACECVLLFVLTILNAISGNIALFTGIVIGMIICTILVFIFSIINLSLIGGRKNKASKVFEIILSFLGAINFVFAVFVTILFLGNNSFKEHQSQFILYVVFDAIILLGAILYIIDVAKSGRWVENWGAKTNLDTETIQKQEELKRYCDYCGAKLEMTDLHCPKCGTKLGTTITGVGEEKSEENQTVETGGDGQETKRLIKEN